jgi:hypothetical protein
VSLIALGLGCGDDGGTGPGSKDESGDCSYVYDFEKGLEGWEAENWSRQGTSRYSGSYAVTTSGPTSEEYHCGEWIYFYPTRRLEMGEGIDLSNCASATLEFWHRLHLQSILGIEGYICQWYGGSSQWCTIKLSLNDGPWEEIKSFGDGVVSIGNWTKVTIPIDDYVGPGSTDVRISFRISAGTSMWGICSWDVDLVSVKGEVRR